MTRHIWLSLAIFTACTTAASAPPAPTTTTTASTSTSTTRVVVAPTTTHTHPPRTDPPEGMEGATAQKLAAIAVCESGGNPRAISRSGTYTGKHQFDDRTWASVGGSGRAMDAPESEQDARAAELYRQRGPQPWPACGRRG